MKLSLVVETAGKWEGKTIPITLSQFLIGRDPQCHLRPASPLISKRHCAVLLRNGKVFVRDFESTNGTFVNDQQIKGEVELKHKDHLKVGPLSFRVIVEAPVPVDRPTPVPPTKKAAGEPSDTDAAAADMLMSILDDGASAGLMSSDPVPEGSTVMDIMPVPPPGGGPVKEKEKAAKPAAPANTSTAAKAILEKYMRRPRT
jgi:predicted component of type VI protein secretion system